MRGLIRRTDQLSGSLQVTRLQFSTSAGPGGPSPITIQNVGPIMLALDRGVVRIQSAHVNGAQTDIQASGTLPLPMQNSTGAQPMNVNVTANTNLAVLKGFSRDVTSSGNLSLTGTVRGTLSNPLINGQLQLKNAALNYASVPNGISNANGVIQFNGDSATVRNLTAESGGGKLTVSGFAARREELRYGLRLNASRVRVRSGVSVIVDGDVNLTGTPQSGVVSGTVTVDQLNYSPQSDLGSTLSQLAPPVPTTMPSPALDRIKLDLRVRTTASTTIQSSLAQNLQADADLQVRGTLANPGMLGRVTLTQGKLLFFGTAYTVNSGTLGFFNPFRIQPILDLSLQTQAKGVDVVLRVTELELHVRPAAPVSGDRCPACRRHDPDFRSDAAGEPAQHSSAKLPTNGRVGAGQRSRGGPGCEPPATGVRHYAVEDRPHLYQRIGIAASQSHAATTGQQQYDVHLRDRGERSQRHGGARRIYAEPAVVSHGRPRSEWDRECKSSL